MGWKEKNACRGAPPGARVLSLGIFHRTEKKGVVSDDIGIDHGILQPLKQSRLCFPTDHPV